MESPHPYELAGVLGAAGGASEQAGGPGVLHGLVAAVRVKLPVQVPQVGPDRVRGEVKLGGDLRNAHVGRQVAQHASLALGQPLTRTGRFARLLRGWARPAKPVRYRCDQGRFGRPTKGAL
jgi:hypothetical protein